MGIKKIKAEEYTCDACGSTQVVTDPVDVVGFSGIVSEQYDGGGSASVRFFACVAACLQEAIGKALEESNK